MTAARVSAADDSRGSGCDGQPIGFVAGKPALKTRCPQAAARRRVVSTHTGRRDHEIGLRKAVLRHRHAALPELRRRATEDHRGHPRAAGDRKDPDSRGTGSAATALGPSATGQAPETDEALHFGSPRDLIEALRGTVGRCCPGPLAPAPVSSRLEGGKISYRLSPHSRHRG
jgi:hypothetical protein